MIYINEVYFQETEFNNNIKYKLHSLYSTYYMLFSGIVSFILNAYNFRDLGLEIFLNCSLNLLYCIDTEDINLCDCKRSELPGR